MEPNLLPHLEMFLVLVIVPRPLAGQSETHDYSGWDRAPLCHQQCLPTTTALYATVSREMHGKG